MSQDETGEKDGNSLDEVEKPGMDYKFFATGLLGKSAIASNSILKNSISFGIDRRISCLC